MDQETLKNAAVAFIVDILVEAQAQLASRTQERLEQLVLKERELFELERLARPKPASDRARLEPRYLDMRQAGQVMGMTPKAFRCAIQRMVLPKGVLVRFGRRMRVDVKAFEKWLAAQSVGHAPPEFQT